MTDGERRVLGMITDRDIAMAANTQGRLLRDIQVESAMSKQVRACSPSASLEEVEALIASTLRSEVMDGAASSVPAVGCACGEGQGR